MLYCKSDAGPGYYSKKVEEPRHRGLLINETVCGPRAWRILRDTSSMVRDYASMVRVAQITRELANGKDAAKAV